MENLTGSERRKKILSMIRESSVPLSGNILGEKTNVSRQVIVQDIALLRREGNDIIATPKGYTLNGPNKNVRLFKLYHTSDQTEEELKSIVDMGGSVLDVMVNHRVYGKMTASLNINNRRDIKVFMEQLKTGKSTPLLNVTAGYHFHHVTADSEETLDEIEKMLKQMNLLAERLPYEYEM